MEGIQDKKFLSKISSYKQAVLGDPKVSPSMGNQYEAAIPSLNVESDRSQLIISKPSDLEVMPTCPNTLLMGLPIPLMWANSEFESTNVAVEFESTDENQITSNNEDKKLKFEPVDAEKRVTSLSNLHPTDLDDKMEVDAVVVKESKTKLDINPRALCPLPGSLGESWRDVECDRFLLGLYIFGKNLNLVKIFVEGKEMGDILSFYYGRFYRSDEYCIWSGFCRKKSKRCRQGKRLFSKTRHMELLSRLISQVSKECQSRVLEVAVRFVAGKISFEGYVFTLKNMVGIDMLVEAVGIGKGKRDLTGREPIKKNYPFSLLPEIPVGKALSSLSSAEIIGFLNGDVRLSKARSSDLFWEAVWPRLLARGWHSEMQNDNGSFCPKNSLVFLTAGVTKFSKSSFVKGKDYFDSVKDVLDKVASEPGLLELEEEAADESGQNEECMWDSSIQDPYVVSTMEYCFYLKPSEPNSTQDLQKYTIVDTSHRAEQPKMQELRHLPVECSRVSNISSISSGTEQYTSEESEEAAEKTSTLNAAEDANVRACADSSDCADSILKAQMPNTSDPSADLENQKTLAEDKQIKNVRHQFSRKRKCSHAKYLAPVTMQKEQASNHGESNCNANILSADWKLKGDDSHPISSPLDARNRVNVLVDVLKLFSCPSSMPKCSPAESNDCILSKDNPGMEVSHGETQFKVTAGAMHTNKVASTDQQPFRRQSTRNRPLTTKALEALECDLFNTQRKRKGADAPVLSLRVRRTTNVSTTLENTAGTGITNSKKETSLDTNDTSKILRYFPGGKR